MIVMDGCLIMVMIDTMIIGSARLTGWFPHFCADGGLRGIVAAISAGGHCRCRGPMDPEFAFFGPLDC